MSAAENAATQAPLVDLLDAYHTVQNNAGVMKLMHKDTTATHDELCASAAAGLTLAVKETYHLMIDLLGLSGLSKDSAWKEIQMSEHLMLCGSDSQLVRVTLERTDESVVRGLSPGQATRVTRTSSTYVPGGYQSTEVKECLSGSRQKFKLHLSISLGDAKKEASYSLATPTYFTCDKTYMQRHDTIPVKPTSMFEFPLGSIFAKEGEETEPDKRATSYDSPALDSYERDTRAWKEEFLQLKKVLQLYAACDNDCYSGQDNLLATCSMAMESVKKHAPETYYYAIAIDGNSDMLVQHHFVGMEAAFRRQSALDCSEHEHFQQVYSLLVCLGRLVHVRNTVLRDNKSLRDSVLKSIVEMLPPKNVTEQTVKISLPSARMNVIAPRHASDPSLTAFGADTTMFLNVHEDGKQKPKLLVPPVLKASLCPVDGPRVFLRIGGGENERVEMKGCASVAHMIVPSFGAKDEEDTDMTKIGGQIAITATAGSFGLVVIGPTVTTSNGQMEINIRDSFVVFPNGTKCLVDWNANMLPSSKNFDKNTSRMPEHTKKILSTIRTALGESQSQLGMLHIDASAIIAPLLRLSVADVNRMAPEHKEELLDLMVGNHSFKPLCDGGEVGDLENTCRLIASAHTKFTERTAELRKRLKTRQCDDDTVSDKSTVDALRNENKILHQQLEAHKSGVFNYPVYRGLSVACDQAVVDLPASPSVPSGDVDDRPPTPPVSNSNFTAQWTANCPSVRPAILSVCGQDPYTIVYPGLDGSVLQETKTTNTPQADALRVLMRAKIAHDACDSEDDGHGMLYGELLVVVVGGLDWDSGLAETLLTGEDPLHHIDCAIEAAKKSIVASPFVKSD